MSPDTPSQNPFESDLKVTNVVKCIAAKNRRKSKELGPTVSTDSPTLEI